MYILVIIPNDNDVIIYLDFSSLLKKHVVISPVEEATQDMSRLAGEADDADDMFYNQFSTMFIHYLLFCKALF